MISDIVQRRVYTIFVRCSAYIRSYILLCLYLWHIFFFWITSKIPFVEEPGDVSLTQMQVHVYTHTYDKLVNDLMILNFWNRRYNDNKLREMMERERGEIFHAMGTKYSAVKSSLIPFVPRILILISIHRRNTVLHQCTLHHLI